MKQEKCVMAAKRPEMIVGMIIVIPFILSVGWAYDRRFSEIPMMMVFIVNMLFAFFFYSMYNKAKGQQQVMEQMGMGGMGGAMTMGGGMGMGGGMDMVYGY